jgi:peptide/nickel transport system permease protein
MKVTLASPVGGVGLAVRRFTPRVDAYRGLAGQPTIEPEVTREERSVAPRGPWQDFWRRIRRDRSAMAAGTFLVTLILLAFVGAPLAAHVTGHAPDEQVTAALDVNGLPLGPLERTFAADGIRHDERGDLFVLGSDNLGRDQLVRLLYGARISLTVAIGATLLALLIGVTLGLVAGWRGRRTDAVISRAIDTAVAFPALLLAIAFGVVLGPGLFNVVLVIALFSWYYPARIVRGGTRSLRASECVDAARSLGATDSRLLRHHVLPHLAAPLLVFSTVVVAQNILLEAGLSYLGVGVPPPTPSWGQMLSDSVSTGLYRLEPSLALVPGIALMLTVLAFNVLGDGLRDALDPRSG